MQMNTKIATAIIVAAVALLTACKNEKVQTPQEAEAARLEAEQAMYASSNRAGAGLRASISAGDFSCERGAVRIGMTEKQARCKWGDPNDVNTTTTAQGISAQWVYSPGRYLYFRDGNLEAIQE